METVAPGIWRIRLGTPEAITPVAVREAPPVLAGLAALPACAAPFAEADIAFRATARGVVVELPLAGTEEIFGFGLQLKSVKQKGRKKTLRVNADPVMDAGDTHAPVPFFVSTAGYGVFVDTARYAIFHVGSANRLAAGSAPSAAAANATTTEELYRARNQARLTTVIEVPVARGVDIYLIGGPTLGQAVQRYNLFSGGGAMPPRWGLGVWYRAFTNCTGVEIEDLARELRADRMPCDVFGLEPGWHARSYSCSFTWDPTRFPEPERTMAALRALGLRVNLWEHCFTHPESPLYAAMSAEAGDYAVWSGAVPDFLRPAARAAFARYHHDHFAAQGISGFKIDECDSSDFTGSWSFPECSQFPSGADGEQMHSLLGVLYQRTILDAFRPTGKRTLSQVRSSHALAAPLPFVLYSDLYDHRDFLRSVVNAGFSGLLWSPEVRQCASVEDLVRRVQSVVLSPQALVNAWMIRHPPWFQVDDKRNNAGEAMPERERAETLVRAAFELRMALVPYLYTAFARYRDEGLPPCRALAFDHPGDAATHALDDQWLIGDALLAAPLIAGQTTRPVYLPAGVWYDFWSGERFAGGRAIDYPCPLERVPLFVRAGTLVPYAQPVSCIGADTRFRLTVRIYGDEAATGALYDDDGEDLVPREVRRWRLGWTPAVGGSATCDGGPGGRYEIVDWRRIG
jgi:alpha-D-xyloside xylohydrolase